MKLGYMFRFPNKKMGVKTTIRRWMNKIMRKRVNKVERRKRNKVIHRWFIGRFWRRLKSGHLEVNQLLLLIR